MARRRKRAYGSGQVVPPRVLGGTWGVRWYDGARRRFRGGFANRELAERVLAHMAGQIAVGRAGLPADPREAPYLGDLAGDFLDRRALTHRAAQDDRYRWEKHLKPHFAHLRPGEIDAARIRAFVEVKLREGLNSATVRIFVALLSSFFADLVERGITPRNAARDLPKSLRRLVRPTHDPRTTPFVEKLDDVRRIYLALPEPLTIGYAVGALAGLRTGEVLALKWSHVDLDARRIHVRESIDGPLKDKESRVVPILDPLLPVLKAWKLKSGGEGLVMPPMRRDGGAVDKQTPSKRLRAVLKQLGLERDGLGWYEATRHTFASQWVLAGGSIEKLKEMMGHHSVVVTERYTHLRPDLFAARDLSIIPLSLAAPKSAVPVQIGQRLGSAARERPRKLALRQEKSRSRSVSRVLCPHRVTALGPTYIHLGAELPRHLISEQPGSIEAGSLPTPFEAGTSLLALAPGGVCRAGRLAPAAVRSYRTLSPLPAPCGAWAVCFLLHCPADHPTGR